MTFHWRFSSSGKKQIPARPTAMKGFWYLSLLTTQFFLCSLPAWATQLEFWRFDANRNQLEFITDEGVQPRAQLIQNPTRLVIDLPGTTLGQAALSQAVGGAIREIRVGQFDRQTTRLVIELAPNYTLDPGQVKFRGIAPNQWTVQLPNPQRVSQAPDSPPVVSSPTPPSSAMDGATQIEAIQVTPDGMYVRTSGAKNPPVSVERSRNRRQVVITFENTGVSPSLPSREISVNRFGVDRLRVSQSQTDPPTTQLTLDVQPTSPNWQASTSSLGGVVLLPGGNIATQPRPQPNPAPVNPPPAATPATIQAVELEDGKRLVIRADKPITYTTGWDRASADYRIAIPSAVLAPNVRGPQLGGTSSVLRVRVRQEDPRTVVILVKPAAGVQIGEVNQPSTGVLALQLEPPRPTAPRPVPVPPPQDPGPNRPLPRVPNGRIVVVVDPGHGGPDPGAVGINGLQEKGIVLDISRQVANILEQQGVTAILTRSDDRDLDLEPRVQMAQRANATLFVSIHANAISMSRPDVNGLETYYFQSGNRLAQTIHRSILESLQIRDRGVRQARFYVLRRTSMPSVLVEVGFVTGREDAARLSNPAYRSQMAAAIARGILQYIR